MKIVEEEKYHQERNVEEDVRDSNDNLREATRTRKTRGGKENTESKRK